MIAPARAAAFQILMEMTRADAHSDELLRAPEVEALTVQDRALATTLVMGTLRWQMKLDARIRPLLSRPDAKLALPVEVALRLGAYQLLYLDRIPAHAAIGEAVELAKQAGEPFAAGMVNAVLRKITRLPREAAEEDVASARAVAAKYAHPVWMVERWARRYGVDAAAAICAFDQEPAAICLRLIHPDAEQSLADEGVELERGIFLTSARRVVRGDVVRSAAFRKGWVRIQEEGSQLVAELAGHGSRILDTCAAPGGKMAILAERNPEARITAWDASKRRLDAMRGFFAPLAERVHFAVQDASARVLEPEYDLILCDVPCSGTGTIERNPEIRFRVSVDAIARQQARQVKILSAALGGLAPGGRLLYSTCSLESEENEAVVRECVGASGKFRLASIASELERLEREGAIHADGALRLKEDAIRDGCLRTLPGISPCDGFYAALLVRDEREVSG